MNKAMPTPRSVATDAEQFGQVNLQVAGVGAAAHGRHVDAQVRGERALRRPGVAGREGLQHAEEMLDPVRGAVPGRQFPHRHVQRGGDRPADRLFRPGLDLPGSPEPLQRHGPERVQQHGLADAAQPGQHHAAFRAAAGYSFQDHFELAKLAVTAGQFRRTLACAGRIRIPHWVHVSNPMARSSKIPRLT